MTELYNSGNAFAYPFSAATGWANKIFNIVPGKILSIDVANISKVLDVS